MGQVGLGGELRYIKIGWNQFYIALLEKYRAELYHPLRSFETYPGNGDT